MDKFITKRGKIFQAGIYKDKKFAITPQELKDITVKNFTSPVPLDLTHKTTLRRLDSKLGQLVGVEADDYGQLFGVVEMPEWLHNVVGKDDDGKDIPLNVSCSFDPTTKVLRKLALTDTPRVGDAAIFAAFSAAHPDEVAANAVEAENISANSTAPSAIDLSGSTEVIVGEGEIATVATPEEVEAALFARMKVDPEIIESLTALTFAEFAKKQHNTPEGQSVMQEMHNFAARFGAICEKPADFHSAHELKGLQVMHDVSKEHGASCSANSNFTASEESDGKETENMDKEKLGILNAVVALLGKPADAPAAASFATTEEVDPVKPEVERNEDGTPKDRSVEERDATIGQPKKVEEPAKDFSAENETLKAQLAEANRKNAELLEATIKVQAEGLAASVPGALPAVRKTLEVAFAQAIRDDLSNSVEVTFGEGETKGSRVDMLKALYNVKSVDLSAELLDPEKTQTLLSSEQPDAAVVSAQAVKERASKLAAQINKTIKR